MKEKSNLNQGFRVWNGTAGAGKEAERQGRRWYENRPGTLTFLYQLGKASVRVWISDGWGLVMLAVFRSSVSRACMTDGLVLFMVFNCGARLNMIEPLQTVAPAGAD